jgi:hypothetical protein
MAIRLVVRRHAAMPLDCAMRDDELISARGYRVPAAAIL